MTVTLSTEIRAELVQKRFENFTTEIPKVGIKSIYDIIFKARNKLATYPPHYAGNPPHVWVSEKQRRYVMAMIRAGKITIPYHRTGHYGWNWRIKRDRLMLETEGISYMLYNTMPYARWVSGGAEGEKQARIHQTRWQVFRKTADQVMEDVPKMINENVALAARRSGFNG
jgi:hypothetical protein